MFNLQGSELVIILLLALVVLGPEKLPEAMRKMGQFYAEMRKMSSGFQEEFRKAVDEPMQEVRKTADILRDSADFTKFADGERDEKPKSAEMADAPNPAADDESPPFVPDPQGDPPSFRPAESAPESTDLAANVSNGAGADAPSADAPSVDEESPAVPTNTIAQQNSSAGIAERLREEARAAEAEAAEVAAKREQQESRGVAVSGGVDTDPAKQSEPSDESN